MPDQRHKMCSGLVRRPNNAAITVIARRRRTGVDGWIRLVCFAWLPPDLLPLFHGSRFMGNILAFKRQIKATEISFPRGPDLLCLRRISEQGPPPILRPKFPSTSTGTARCQQPYYRVSLHPLQMLMYEPVGGSVRLRCSGSKYNISVLLYLILITKEWGYCRQSERTCASGLSMVGSCGDDKQF
ncbi:hypothetical protein T01_5160 [Trichinella spiralis]|uniref:Uncharacterized protein n=1 Tax=Trichinella spiralis TaxID=6334 RepID=A0A0V1BU09_TRISP|nr:hypothetical protein T01_5160 [Trichinella spiralis]